MKATALTHDNKKINVGDLPETFDQACKDASSLVSVSPKIKFIVICQ